MACVGIYSVLGRNSQFKNRFFLKIIFSSPAFRQFCIISLSLSPPPSKNSLFVLYSNVRLEVPSRP
jgi:hypothetical protein